MAKLTREQFNKWSAQAFNGFELDIEFYIGWNEKRLEYITDLDGENKAQIIVEYFPEYETKTNDYGCKWNVRTGRHIPEIVVNSLTPTSSGSGCYVVVERYKEARPERVQAKKNYKVLCEITKEIDTEKLINEIFKSEG